MKSLRPEKITQPNFTGKSRPGAGFSARNIDSVPGSGNIRIYANDITERKCAEQGLIEMNRNLKMMVEEKVAENMQKDQIVHVEFRLAAMGEMIGNIAHQWRQPLNALGLIIQNIRLYHKSGKLDEQMIKEFEKKCMDMILHMSRTIDDFRDFFKPDKEKKAFNLREIAERTLSIIEAVYKDNGVSLTLNVKEDLKAFGYPNEYAQVLLNILNNARQIIQERQVQNPFVRIEIFSEGGRSVIAICDNGGGIKEENINKVFEPYYSTRPSGTGIGLYMSKIIIEKNMGGRLSVSNKENGAEFRIEVPGE